MSRISSLTGQRLLQAALIFGLVGTGLELALLEHYEDAWQLIPIVLLASGLVGTVWHIAAPTRYSARVLSILMLAFALAGLLGLWLHFKGNMEFELEMYPGLTGWPLIWKTLGGAVPALAPGTMVFVGLVGFVVARSPGSAPVNQSQKQ
ncbi:MAG: hypothetical protein OXM02_11670 [Bacteroidota bacterium]|nr:hypothetical protein [Bacteroidota bacterium]MDE2835159.1 hypothetical protein [Bacteroidota bacterium]MDE2957014.1 hypothetical protein [Bacteroidota bacterium]